MSGKGPHLVIILCIRLRNLTPSECQPVMEGPWHQLCLNDTPPPTAKGPSAASPLPVSGAVTGGRGGRRFTWGRGVPAPWSPPPWPRESASASSLPAAPFAVAGLHCLDGMGSQACPFPTKSFLREEVEKNREGGE